MFLTDCVTCGLRELRGARSIESLVSTERGLALVYRCNHCEAVNLLDGNGSVTNQPQPAVPVAVTVAA